MDLDTTHNKKSYENIIGAFERGEVDILIGTQMITKGLDFDSVSVVGILNADNLLNFPDFRANERAYQLISQVSGRAGRKNKRGTVILQTSNPEHPIIRQVMENDYNGMYINECVQRQMFHYPPYSRLIEITLRYRELQKLNEASTVLATELGKIFGRRVLGPIAPLIPRVQNFYIKNILLKIEITSSSEKAKQLIKQTVHHLLAISQFKALKITVDVDPL
jgi:primosomal protein N' (replication factor Y)